jgi:transposase
MEGEASAYQRYVGIDIAADTFTAAWRTRAGKPTLPFTAEQTPAGFAALQRRLAASGAVPADVLVVMEATGNYVRRFTARAIPPAGRAGSEGYLWAND